MDCDDSHDLLLDLVYDELDEVRAAALRRHLEACARCRGALAQLRATRRSLAQLPTVDPPPVSDALRAALEAAAARNAPAAAEATPQGGVAPATGPVDAEHLAPVLRLDAAPHRRLAVHDLVRRAGALAMRRQVAMAAVFLVMLGFGVRYLPAHRTAPLTTLDTPMPEVIPATQLPRETPTAGAAPGGLEGPIGRRHLQPQPGPAPRATPTVAANAGRARSNALQAAESAAAAQTRAASSTRDDGNAERAAPPQRDNVWAAPAPAGRTALAQESPSAAQAPAAPAAAPSPAPERSWQSLEREAEQHRAEGRSTQAAEALRQALALNPPPEARRNLARALHADLLRTGQVREAAEVRAQHLTAASDDTGLAGSLPAASSGSTPATSTPTPSTYRPSMPRPARRSLNMQNELNSQFAY
jgi:hypothetical protein